MEERIVIKVPYDKKSEFMTRFFYTLSEAIDFLGYNYGKSPDVITFQGKIGREILESINTTGWNLDKFNPSIVGETSIYSDIVISYNKKIKLESNSGVPRHDILNGKIINGIPGPDTINKLISYSSNYSSVTERYIDPKYIIVLKREK